MEKEGIDKPLSGPITTYGYTDDGKIVTHLYEDGKEVGIRLGDGREYKGDAYSEYLRSRKRPIP